MVSINKELVLGLDIGCNSLGWALTRQVDGISTEIIKTGVYVFPAGKVPEGKMTEYDAICSGKAQSRAVDRRNDRALRKSHRRFKQRIKKLQNILQRAGLFPTGDVSEFIKRFDNQIYVNNCNNYSDKKQFSHVIPYFLRKKALDERLDDFELGRAIYHLAHRRGFLSNRKAIGSDEDDSGIVKKSIGELYGKISGKDCRTLGEYLFFINPEEERIRQRYTHRKMYIDEFEIIWETQKRLGNSLLTDQLKKDIYNAIFYQRKLKSKKQDIAECIFEKGKKRTAKYHLDVQEYLVYQAVNNLKIKSKDGETRDLSSDEWLKCVNYFMSHKIVKYTTLRKHLCLKNVKFSIEAELDDKETSGNTTLAPLLKLFGDNWNNFSVQEQEQIVLDIWSYEKETALQKRGMKRWGLDEAAAKKFSKIILKPEYCNLSREAINKLLIHLKDGRVYADAVDQVYGKSVHSLFEVPTFDLLPPTNDEKLNLQIMNPVVNRCLTIVRRVVNAIIKEYGKPGMIRVQTAREVKFTDKQKKQINRNNFQNEKEKKMISAELNKTCNIENPKRFDYIKYRLWVECNGVCPYTQKQISLNDLFGDAPDYDIKHIIPFSRSGDNSFANLTLCYHQENRHIKGNKTPYEAYHNDDNKWHKILESVKIFKGKFSKDKLKRFQVKDVSKYLEGFTERNLNDTKYATKLTMKYLSCLYGGVYEGRKGGKRRIEAVQGQLTAFMRELLGTYKIMGGSAKNRDNYKHHAVDALVVSLISGKIVKRITNIVKSLDSYQHRLNVLKLRFPDETKLQPWTNFIEDCQKSIESINVVHDVNMRDRGKFHKDGMFRLINENNNTVHVSVAITDLDAKKIESIVDPAIMKIIKDKLNELGESNPGKAFAKEENFPRLKDSNENVVNIIKKVRIKRKQNLLALGEVDRKRHVVTGNNHHIKIWAKLDNQGNETKWCGDVVSLFEVYQRKKEKKQTFDRSVPHNCRFKMFLQRGNIIRIKQFDEKEELFVISTIPQSKQLTFKRIYDARALKDIKKHKESGTALPNSLLAKHCHKIKFDALGNIVNN